MAQQKRRNARLPELPIESTTLRQLLYPADLPAHLAPEVFATPVTLLALPAEIGIVQTEERLLLITPQLSHHFKGTVDLPDKRPVRLEFLHIQLRKFIHRQIVDTHRQKISHSPGKFRPGHCPGDNSGHLRPGGEQRQSAERGRKWNIHLELIRTASHHPAMSHENIPCRRRPPAAAGGNLAARRQRFVTRQKCQGCRSLSGRRFVPQNHQIALPRHQDFPYPIHPVCGIAHLWRGKSQPGPATSENHRLFPQRRQKGPACSIGRCYQQNRHAQNGTPARQSRPATGNAAPDKIVFHTSSIFSPLWFKPM